MPLRRSWTYFAMFSNLKKRNRLQSTISFPRLLRWVGIFFQETQNTLRLRARGVALLIGWFRGGAKLEFGLGLGYVDAFSYS